ncbi:metallophosphoesterase family protein [Bradyrhizobium sp. SYSU BS000235]|uniref:metallophosphoesterase family protein n=1 Tax=Bradyrhizobium sp. SYSU BS000235 TaxID=3411332 RepID=UPI003C733650
MTQSHPTMETESRVREVLLVDPRQGDAEDDRSATKQRSLFAIAGSLLVEISLPKLLLAWTMSLALPAVLLGLAPLVATGWAATATAQARYLTGLGAALSLMIVLAVGWFAWRPLFRMAEVNFWSLNALAVQPGYVFCREAIRHLAEGWFGAKRSAQRQARLRAASSAAAGTIVCIVAVLVAIAVWPYTRWLGSVSDLMVPYRLIVPTLANAVALTSLYLAAAALIWGFADASMDQPVDIEAFDDACQTSQTWRVAHLSDVHTVGERYGFRMESGRGGPQGNDRLERLLARLAAIHASAPLDAIVVTGDMTDAGLATEWAEFLDATAKHPTLVDRMLILPGNHDINIVDRTNPARLDLPFSPGKRFRQMRTLSAMALMQGVRVRVIEEGPAQSTRTLDQNLNAHRSQIAAFAQGGGIMRAAKLGDVFDDQFPMAVLPQSEDGLGIVILDSNAQTHFSFTNALGLVSVQQAKRLATVMNGHPKARWIVALHHHLMEYPMPGVKFSERVGTALVNGSWFVRKLKPFAHRIVVMHGHRHIDWIGTCGALRIISAPSPVMNATDDMTTHFHIHTFANGADGRLCLLAPEKVEIGGVAKVDV